MYTDLCMHICACVGMYMYILDDTYVTTHSIFNTLRPRQHGRNFADDISMFILLNEHAWLSRITNIPVMVQIIGWRWPCDKPLSEPMMFNKLTHVCVTNEVIVLFRNQGSASIYVLFIIEITVLQCKSTAPLVTVLPRRFCNLRAIG